MNLGDRVMITGGFWMGYFGIATYFHHVGFTPVIDKVVVRLGDDTYVTVPGRDVEPVEDRRFQ